MAVMKIIYIRRESRLNHKVFRLSVVVTLNLKCQVSALDVNSFSVVCKKFLLMGLS